MISKFLAFGLLCTGLLATRAAVAQDAAAGQAVFMSHCRICHSPVAGKNMLGPSLFGVVGRKAGTVPGYSYSPANASSGLTWDAPTLETYLTNPAAEVPHTKMTFAGLQSAKDRTDIIAYLSTLH